MSGLFKSCKLKLGTDYNIEEDEEEEEDDMDDEMYGDYPG